MDSRVTPVPSWLNGWTKTGKTMTNNKDVTFNLYKKNFAANSTVTLGTNGDSTSTVNYTVIAKPNNSFKLTSSLANTLDYALKTKNILQ